MTLFHPSGVVSNIMDIFLLRWRNGVTKICNTCYNHHYHTVHFPILFHVTCQPSSTLWIYVLVTVMIAVNTRSSKSGSRLVGNNIHHYAQKVCWAPRLLVWVLTFSGTTLYNKVMFLQESFCCYMGVLPWLYTVNADPPSGMSVSYIFKHHFRIRNSTRSYSGDIHYPGGYHLFTELHVHM